MATSWPADAELKSNGLAADTNAMTDTMSIQIEAARGELRRLAADPSISPDEAQLLTEATALTRRAEGSIRARELAERAIGLASGEGLSRSQQLVMSQFVTERYADETNLAMLCGLTERTVLRALAMLESLGLVSSWHGSWSATELGWLYAKALCEELCEA